MKLLTYSGLIVFVLSLLSIQAKAQNERKFVRQGNNIYEQALSDTTKLDTTAFSQAETAYRKALDKRPDDLKWNFNLGDALYKQMKFDQSESTFEDIAEKSTDSSEKSQAYYNLGNSMLMQNKLDESIEAYKDALRNNPDDIESKYNLIYAMNLKKQQEQEQEKQDQDQDKDQDKNEDENQDQDQNKDQNKDQEQDQDQNKDNQDKQQDQQKNQPQEQKISKENAEQLLQALQNQEEKIQERVKEEQAKKAQQRQTDKDW